MSTGSISSSPAHSYSPGLERCGVPFVQNVYEGSTLEDLVQDYGRLRKSIVALHGGGRRVVGGQSRRSPKSV